MDDINYYVVEILIENIKISKFQTNINIIIYTVPYRYNDHENTYYFRKFNKLRTFTKKYRHVSFILLYSFSTEIKKVMDCILVFLENRKLQVYLFILFIQLYDYKAKLTIFTPCVVQLFFSLWLLKLIALLSQNCLQIFPMCLKLFLKMEYSYQSCTIKVNYYFMFTLSLMKTENIK